MSTPRFKSEPEWRKGEMRSGRCRSPMDCKSQSPQFLNPSEAVHGRSKANRKTLRVPMSMAAGITGHG
jgi:hypothetical protein